MLKYIIKRLSVPNSQLCQKHTFTARIRMKTEGNIFGMFTRGGRGTPIQPTREGGFPPSFKMGMYPILPDWGYPYPPWLFAILLDGVPPSFLTKGYPILPDREYPILIDGGTPFFPTGSTPSFPMWVPNPSWWGTPSLLIGDAPSFPVGVPLSHQDLMGYPTSLELDGGTPIRTGWGYPRYAAGGMHLAFRQENSLV